ncbi:MAG: DUF2254 domain-containing protein [Streptosporangiaceae bacterium]|nr:DUF2254 domain-containing protein [Streptosporangiaceae bacterium]MBV9855213.1 DUF2254 domain-containing protein [Streptosporangiaceae bacterium]
MGIHRISTESDWRSEALRTNLWLIPAIESLAAAAAFAVTLAVDRAAYRGTLTLPAWVISGTADGARQILTALAAAIITVVGVVFSIILVTLTLASTQFGPRMLRTFIRDRGTQLTLGTFVATFFYAMLALIVIGPGNHGDFVPHLSITVALALTAVDLGILIYFIHHTAKSIQLPEVIASIARDLTHAISAEMDPSAGAAPDTSADVNGPSLIVLQSRLERSGRVVSAPASGYLRFVRHATLVRIAAEYDAVIRLHHRPGHFLVQGHPMATVWPAEVSDKIARRLARVHITGPLRTLTQDIAFGVDQLVEIAIRALSPAVNDTFTAMTCIDWLSDSLCTIAVQWHPALYHRDGLGHVRLITAPVSYERLVQRSFEKIRQAAGGMPAVLIRQLEALIKIMTVAPAGRKQILLDQAAMIRRVSLRTVPEETDQADITARYEELLALHSQLTGTAPAPLPGEPGGVAGRRAELVPDPVLGDQASAVGRAELVPQPADVHVDRAAALGEVALPHLPDEVGPAEHGGRVRGQEGQQLELLVRQRYLPAAGDGPPLRVIQNQVGAGARVRVRHLPGGHLARGRLPGGPGHGVTDDGQGGLRAGDRHDGEKRAVPAGRRMPRFGHVPGIGRVRRGRRGEHLRRDRHIPGHPRSLHAPNPCRAIACSLLNRSILSRKTPIEAPPKWAGP